MSFIYSPRTIPLSLLIAILFLLNPMISVAQVTSSSKIFRFSLAAVAQVNTSGRSQIIPVVDNMVLQSGNLIKFYLDLEKEGYLIFSMKILEVSWFFCFRKIRYQQKFEKDTPVYIPEGNNWIELDSRTGKETFHLLVSAVGFERLENLYDHHVMLKEKDDIKQSVESILDQIKSLKRENFGKQAERPIRIAGKLRGNSPVVRLSLRSYAIWPRKSPQPELMSRV